MSTLIVIFCFSLHGISIHPFSGDLSYTGSQGTWRLSNGTQAEHANSRRAERELNPQPQRCEPNMITTKPFTNSRSCRSLPLFLFVNAISNPAWFSSSPVFSLLDTDTTSLTWTDLWSWIFSHSSAELLKICHVGFRNILLPSFRLKVIST